MLCKFLMLSDSLLLWLPLERKIGSFVNYIANYNGPDTTYRQSTFNSATCIWLPLFISTTFTLVLICFCVCSSSSLWWSLVRFLQTRLWVSATWFRTVWTAIRQAPMWASQAKKVQRTVLSDWSRNLSPFACFAVLARSFDTARRYFCFNRWPFVNCYPEWRSHCLCITSKIITSVTAKGGRL